MEDYFFERLKDRVLADRGFDFNLYNQRHVKRRINARLMALKIPTEDYRSYIKLLESNPAEYARLFDVLSINVTEFFRDPTVWRVIRNRIFPEILQRKDSPEFHNVLRIWSAGCSEGQEPYSIAITLSDLLARAKNKPRVTIIASDIDQDAINKARRGVYETRLLKNVSPDILLKYFIREDSDHYRISDDIKGMVVFKKHNLTLDDPIKNMDMVFCRNVVIYFKRESKAVIFKKFHDALLDTGFLVVGKSEILISKESKELFDMYIPKEHVYLPRKKNKS